MKKGSIAFIVFTVSTLVLVAVTLNPKEQSSESEQSTDTTQTFTIENSSSTIYVSGVVTAADTAIISAKTNGVITLLPVSEGVVVKSGQLVATQATPVADAQIAYQVALQEQTSAEQAMSVDARAYAAEKAATVARSTDVLAALQIEAVQTQLQADTGRVRTAVDAGLTTLLDSIAFVDKNPSLFDDKRQEQFREIVNEVYGRIPNQFGGLMYHDIDPAPVNIREVLEKLRVVDTAALSIPEVETLGVVVMSQLNALTMLYTTAESDVLDRDVVTQADDVYATYFANRKNITESLSALEQAQQNLQGKIDNLSEAEISSKKSVDVSALDEELATRQATFSAALATAAKRASDAATTVAIAEASLGNIQAPFTGTVSHVLAEIGEYKTAGEPLFTLHGSSGRELRVNVPVTLSPQLRVGGVLLVQGEIAGLIDRISPTSSGHTVEVFVSLLDSKVPVGTSLQGELEFKSADTTAVLPREYLFFGYNATPVVRTITGDEYPISVLVDNGSSLIVNFTSEYPAHQLVPSRTVSF